MVKRLFVIQVLVFLFLLFNSSSLLAEVRSEVNRKVLSIDETLGLRIILTNGSGGEPDLSVLQKDFEILDKSQSQSYSFINGRSSSSHTWNITLLAKNTGEIMIPAIPVGNESTQSITILVNKTSSNPAQDGKDVFVELSISPDEEVFVQQQVLLTVSLYHKVRFSNASLSEPSIENAVIERMGNENNFQKTVGQHTYNVIERRYAIYPQQHGTLHIPGIVFSGNIEQQQQQNRFSFFSRPGRRIISRTEPVNLTVLPIPDSFSGKNWLPARHLTIEADIIEDVTELKAGEAFTRRIAVTAVGLLGSQLPSLTLSSTSDYKSYPDKESIDTQFVGNDMMGTRQDTMAIIPLRAGKISLPEIKIDWWNIDTQQQETTILPATTLRIEKNAAMPDIAKVVPKQQKVQPLGNSQPAEPLKTTNQISEMKNDLLQNVWFWSSLLLLLLWLGTLGWNWSRRKQVIPKEVKPNAPIDDIKSIQKQIKQSCADNDPHKTTQLLVKWARLYFDDRTISGLAQVMERVNEDEFVSQMNLLEQSRYAPVQTSWTGNNFCQAFENYLRQHKKHTVYENEPALAPLNPV